MIAPSFTSVDELSAQYIPWVSLYSGRMRHISAPTEDEVATGETNAVRWPPLENSCPRLHTLMALEREIDARHRGQRNRRLRGHEEFLFLVQVYVNNVRCPVARNSCPKLQPPQPFTKKIGSHIDASATEGCREWAISVHGPDVRARVPYVKPDIVTNHHNEETG